MKTFLKYLKTPYFLWVIFCIPLINIIRIGMSIPLETKDFKLITHISGEFGARLLIVTLMIAPLGIFFKGKIHKWFIKNKKHFGLAAFGYSLIHLIAYLLYTTFDEALWEMTDPEYLTGWLAFIIMLPLTLTSTHYAVKVMGGRKWKMLHRSVYACAVLTALHWLLVSHNPSSAILHFTPLVILESIRIYRELSGKNKHHGH